MSTPTASSPLNSGSSDSLKQLISAATTEQEIQELEALLLGTQMTQGEPEPSRWMARTLGEVAEFFGMQLQTVKEWRTGPQPMPGEEGKWPLSEIAQWRDARMRPGMRSELDEKRQAAEVRLKEMQAKRAELKYRKEQGELVERSAVASVLARICTEIRTRLEAIAPEVGTTAPPDLRREIVRDVANKVAMALRKLAGLSAFLTGRNEPGNT
jgi:phage terminase Nu1 subunit (DNA packaging protein)